MAPLTAKYLAALKRLKAKLAKEQKLEQALAVDAVIRGVQEQETKDFDNNKTPPETEGELRRFLIGTSWRTKPTDVEKGLIFYSDGSFKSPREQIPTGKYVIDGTKIMSLIWSGNVVVKCEFSPDFKSFKEVNAEGNTWRLLGRVEKR